MQFRFVPNAQDLSIMVVQMHRALAKMEKKLEQDPLTAAPVLSVEKGVRDGPHLVSND